MRKRIHLCFDWEYDYWRVAQVRSHWRARADWEESGLLDPASAQGLLRLGEGAVRRWLDREIDGSALTLVLIGTRTADCAQVEYQLGRSVARRNGLLGIRIHALRDAGGGTGAPGMNPLERFRRSSGPGAVCPFRTFDWVADAGPQHWNEWIDRAFPAPFRNKAMRAGPV